MAPARSINYLREVKIEIWMLRVSTLSRHENAKAIDLSKRQIEDGTERKRRSDESQGLRKESKSQTGPEAGDEDQD